MDLDTFMINYKDLFHYIPRTNNKCGRLYIHFVLYNKIFDLVNYKYSNDKDRKEYTSRIFLLICRKHNLSSGDLVITNNRISFMFITKKTVKDILLDCRFITPTYGIHPDVAIFNGLGKLQTNFPLDYWDYQWDQKHITTTHKE